MSAIYCFELFGGQLHPAKLCIKALISHDIAARQWRGSHLYPYLAREMKIHQKMSTNPTPVETERDIAIARVSHNMGTVCAILQYFVFDPGLGSEVSARTGRPFFTR
jgi:hypothetical protein